MKYFRRSHIPLVAALVLYNSVSYSEVRINGFASFVGGFTTSESESRSLFTGAVSDTTFIADGPTNGVYDDEVSFKPDSILGLQFSADLSDGLSVTGQITGAGGEDFDANVAWAYLSYEFNESFTMLMGRQRIPLFFYSDFLDVGYTYHWIRPPVETAGTAVDDFEGIQLRYTTSTDNWDSRFQFYGGANSTESPTLGPIRLDNLTGVVAYTSNDWLQLRATYTITDLALEDTQLTSGGLPNDKDNPTDIDFWGVAAHATFGNLFVVAEYTHTEFDPPVATDVTLGFEEGMAYFISTGYRIGDFTPHITFSAEEADNTADSVFLTQTQSTGAEAWTIGLRWDFHSQAVFKVEYLMRDDTSDSFIKNNAGIGVASPGLYAGGSGDPEEVDLFTFGIDLIF